MREGTLTKGKGKERLTYKVIMKVNHDGLHTPYKSGLSVHGAACARGDLHNLWNTNLSLISFF